MERIARLETMARAGYAARGLVYLLLGYLAVSSGSSQGARDVFQRLRDAPAGTLVLLFTALGLAGGAAGGQPGTESALSDLAGRKWRILLKKSRLRRR